MAIQSAINQLVATTVAGAYAVNKRNDAKVKEQKKVQSVAPSDEQKGFYTDTKKMNVGNLYDKASTGYALRLEEFGESVDFRAIAMRRMAQTVIDKKKQKDNYNNFVANLKNNKRRAK